MPRDRRATVLTTGCAVPGYVRLVVRDVSDGTDGRKIAEFCVPNSLACAAVDNMTLMLDHFGIRNSVPAESLHQ